MVMENAGLQKPGGLGMQPLENQPGPRMVPVQVKIDSEQVKALVEEQLAEMTSHLDSLTDSLQIVSYEHRRLWLSLKVLADWIATLPTNVDETLSPEVQQAIETLTSIELRPGPVCPECAQGKHDNCTIETLHGDEMVPCTCPEHGA